jgi:Peptidase family M23
MMKRSLHITIIFLLGLAYAAPCPPGSDRFIYPVNGTVSDHIGSPRDGGARTHDGIDIAAPTGTPVVAAGGGTVIFAGPTSGAGGNIVKIQHPNGTIGFYAHLNTIGVSTGGTVSQGTTIGTVGNTGIGTGPHLHFEIQPPGGGNRRLNVGGQTWDDAAGINIGQTTSAGSCISSLAAGPGGKVDGNQGGTGDGNGTGGTGGPTVSVDPNGVNVDLAAIDLETLLPTPKKWLDATIKAMADFELAKHLNTLGFALLFCCFVYALVNANYFYQSDQYLPLFGRLIIAAGLIWGSPAITKSMVLTWESVHDNMHTSIVKPATTELQNGINNFAPLLALVGGATVLANTGGALTPDSVPGFDIVEKVLYGVGTITGQITSSLFALMVLLGSIYGIYLLMIYTSGMIAVLAGVLLPVLAAFLVLPGSASWFTRWFSMVVMSLVSVVVLPFVLYVVVMVGVKEPIAKSNAIAQQMVTEIEKVKTALEKGPNLLLTFFSASAGMAEYAARVIPVMLSAYKNLAGLMLQWIFSLILLAIAVLAGVYILQQVPRVLTGFLGGAFGGAAGAVSGGALAAGIASSAGAFGGAASAGSNALAKSMGGKGGKDEATSQKQLAAAPAGGSRAALPPAGGSSASGSGNQSSNSSKTQTASSKK